MRTEAQIKEAITKLEVQRDMVTTKGAQMSRTFLADALRWALGENGTITETCLEGS